MARAFLVASATKETQLLCCSYSCVCGHQRSQMIHLQYSFRNNESTEVHNPRRDYCKILKCYTWHLGRENATCNLTFCIAWVLSYLFLYLIVSSFLVSHIFFESHSIFFFLYPIVSFFNPIVSSFCITSIYSLLLFCILMHGQKTQAKS